VLPCFGAASSKPKGFKRSLDVWRCTRRAARHNSRCKLLRQTPIDAVRSLVYGQFGECAISFDGNILVKQHPSRLGLDYEVAKVDYANRIAATGFTAVVQVRPGSTGCRPQADLNQKNLAARNLTLELRIQPASSTTQVHRISNRHTSPAGTTRPAVGCAKCVPRTSA